MTRTKSESTIASFETREVIGSTIAVTNAGDGLSKAMDIEPVELHIGDVVHVVLECEVAKVTHTVSKDDNSKLVRVQSLRAGVATIVAAELVEEVIDAQRAKNDEAAGLARLPFDEDAVGEEL